MATKRNKKCPYKHVSVTWLDTVSENSWVSIAEAIAAVPAECVTNGVLLHQDDTRVIIAHNYDNANEQCDYTVIPRGVVVSIK